MASDGSFLRLVPRTDPIRVLLADDEPALRTGLTELLGHEERVELVGTAADAEEAIRMAEENRPDVALVDVRMPEGGGPHAARGITRVSPGTRVVALSAYEDRANVLAMLRAGAVGYLVKGTAADELVDGIATVARGGTSLSAEVMTGVVAELATQLRREEIEREADDAIRGDVERFVSGHGVWIVYSRSSTWRRERGSGSRRSRGSDRSPSARRTVGSPTRSPASSGSSSSSGRCSRPSRDCRRSTTARSSP